MSRRSARKEPASRPCSRSGCDRPGEYRAPLAPDRTGSFQYLCLEHVREFNRSWNFFEGWSKEAIEAWQHADLSWHRPTWPASPPHHLHRVWTGDGVRDVFGVVGDGTCDPATARLAAMSATERKARSILDIGPDADEAAIRRRFKKAVKACHPDINGGGGKANGRLRDVIWAYQHLTGTGHG